MSELSDLEIEYRRLKREQHADDPRRLRLLEEAWKVYDGHTEGTWQDGILTIDLRDQQ